MSRYRLTYQGPIGPVNVDVDAGSLAEAQVLIGIILDAQVPDFAIQVLWEGDEEPEDRRLRRMGAAELPGLEV